jgi:hypothetical protein
MPGYHSATTQKFLSLDPNAGDCKSVTRVIDNTYYADKNGYWSGSVSFRSSAALYLISLRNFEGDIEKYNSGMASAKAELALVGQKAEQQNLAENLLYWMMWDLKFGASYFHMTGDIATIFDK